MNTARNFILARVRPAGEGSDTQLPFIRSRRCSLGYWIRSRCVGPSSLPPTSLAILPYYVAFLHDPSENGIVEASNNRLSSSFLFMCVSFSLSLPLSVCPSQEGSCQIVALVLFATSYGSTSCTLSSLSSSSPANLLLFIRSLLDLTALAPAPALAAPLLPVIDLSSLARHLLYGVGGAGRPQ